MHGRHYGSGNTLSSSLPHRHINAIRQGILHISVVHLLHIGFILQIWRDEIMISIVAILLMKIVIIEIVPRNAGNILQVVK